MVDPTYISQKQQHSLGHTFIPYESRTKQCDLVLLLGTRALGNQHHTLKKH